MLKYLMQSNKDYEDDDAIVEDWGFFVDLEEYKPIPIHKNILSLGKYYHKGNQHSKFVNLPTIYEEPRIPENKFSKFFKIKNNKIQIQCTINEFIQIISLLVFLFTFMSIFTRLFFL